MTVKIPQPIKVKDLDARAQAMFEAGKNSFLLCLLGRLGGTVRLPVSEVDDYPVGRGMNLTVDGDALVLELIEGPNVKVAADANGE